MSDAKQDTSPAALRSQMLRRAGIAGGLIVVLLAALAWFENLQREEHAAPPPLVMAPPPPERPAAGAPPMPSATEVEAAVAAEGGAPESEGVTPAAVEQANLPPVLAAPAAVDETPPAVVGSPRLVLKGEEAPARKAAVDPERPEPPPVTAPAKPARAAADAARPRSGYLVQLGVFSATDNAQALHDKVVAMGIEAHIESRVVVGPFKDRAAADAAREKLRKSGLGKGLVVRTP